MQTGRASRSSLNGSRGVDVVERRQGDGLAAFVGSAGLPSDSVGELQQEARPPGKREGVRLGTMARAA